MDSASESSDAVLTIPNLISLARLALVPVFVWTFLTGRDAAALVLLFVIANSDWIDGFVARKIGQVSELGKILDPVSDRVAIVAVMLAVTFRGLIPIAIAALILGRELLIAVAFAILEGRGVPRIPVNTTGKVATVAVFLGTLLVVLSTVPEAQMGENLRLGGVYVLALGAFLYWVAAALYFRELRRRS